MAWEAKGLVQRSHRSMSSTVRPWRASSLGTANTGPMPISSGSQPATARPLNAPRATGPGARPRVPISTQALAPSDSCEALPAVMNLSGPLHRFQLWPGPRRWCQGGCSCRRWPSPRCVTVLVFFALSPPWSWSGHDSSVKRPAPGPPPVLRLIFHREAVPAPRGGCEP